MYKDCKQKNWFYILYCVAFLFVVGFFSSNIHWSIYSVFSSVDSDTQFYFKSRFNAIIQKTIYISIYAVCELDIKDKKQM